MKRKGILVSFAFHDAQELLDVLTRFEDTQKKLGWHGALKGLRLCNRNGEWLTSGKVVLRVDESVRDVDESWWLEIN